MEIEDMRSFPEFLLNEAKSSPKGFLKKYEYTIDKAMERDDWRYIENAIEEEEGGRIEIDDDGRHRLKITPAIVNALLAMAVDFGCEEIIKTLINHYGADCKRNSGHLLSSIIEANIPPTLEIVEILLENGADPNKKDSEGLIPLEVLLSDVEGLGPDTDSGDWDDGVKIAEMLIAAGSKKPRPSAYGSIEYTGRIPDMISKIEKVKRK